MSIYQHITPSPGHHHSMAFQTHAAGTDINKDSFFPRTIRNWNTLSSSAEIAGDCVAKFTPFVRQLVLIPPTTGPQFWRFIS